MSLRNKSFTGVILARGGSKGLKLKNIQLLAGKPLLWYTIKAARDSGIFDQLVVSTDHPAIKAVAWVNGVDVIERPEELSSDIATSEDAMAHACLQLHRMGLIKNPKTDYVCLLEPTHPLLSGVQLRAAAEMLIKSGKDAILSVIESDVPYVGILPDTLSLQDFIPIPLRKKRRQDLKQTYFIGGGIYITRWDVLAQAGDFFACDSIAYVLSKIEGIDINNREDLRIAEAILSNRVHQLPSRLRVIWRVIRRVVGI